MIVESIVFPSGLPGGDWYIGRMARDLGFREVRYDPAALGVRPLESVLDLWTGVAALLVLPTSVPVRGPAVGLLEGRVRCLGSPSTGTDHVDVAELDQRSIGFLHSPGANSRSVVEYVLSALLFAPGGAERLSTACRFAIVGCGRIGGSLASVLKRLGAEVVYCDPFVPEHPDRLARVSLPEALEADVVTLHVPLTDVGPSPTRHMITEELADGIRQQAILINTARGGVVTEEAYRKLCRRCFCVMDVFPQEPPPAWQVDVAGVCTPHVAGYNHEARLMGSRMVAQAFLRRHGSDVVLADPPAPPYNCYVVDFFAEEDHRLRDRPDSFARRRSNYPPRGGFEAFCQRQSHLSAEVQRVREALRFVYSREPAWM